MTPPVRETPAPPPLQPGARFAAACARARETYRLLAVACTLAVVLTAATVVGLVPLAVGWAVHGVGPRDPWGIARRSAVGGGVGAALLVGDAGEQPAPAPAEHHCGSQLGDGGRGGLPRLRHPRGGDGAAAPRRPPHRMAPFRAADTTGRHAGRETVTDEGDADRGTTPVDAGRAMISA